MRNRRILVPILALLFGCASGPTPDWVPDGGAVVSKAEYLTGDPIDGLPSYQAGRVLHPFRAELADRDRFPLPGRGLATDPRCMLGDDANRKCRVYLCDATLSCPSGWECSDVALQFDPTGSPEPLGPGGLVPVPGLDGRYWFVWHVAACL